MCKLDQIIDKCKQGDRKAAEKLYRLFSAKMFAICIRFSKDRADAEDILQDGFIKIFDSIKQYSGKGSFEGWMKRIFINLALEKFRKNHQIQLVEDYPDTVDCEVDEDTQVPADVLIHFVEELPERYRMVFRLRLPTPKRAIWHSRANVSAAEIFLSFFSISAISAESTATGAGMT